MVKMRSKSHKRRKPLSNPKAHQIIKSNLTAWENQSDKTSFREQESTYATLKKSEPKRLSALAKLDNHKPKSIRRDDADLGGHRKFQTTKYDCRDVVATSTKIRKQLIKDKSALKNWRRLFLILIREYIESVRQCGNFCLECEKPVNVKRYRISEFDKDEISELQSLSAADSLKVRPIPLKDDDERKRVRHRLTVKERYKGRYDAEGRLYTGFIPVKPYSIISYLPEGETVCIAEVAGCHLIFNTKTNSLASPRDIAKIQSINFRECPKIRIVVKNGTCRCERLKRHKRN